MKSIKRRRCRAWAREVVKSYERDPNQWGKASVKSQHLKTEADGENRKTWLPLGEEEL